MSIRKGIPLFLRKIFLKFARTKSTTLFESFTNGKFEYWSFVLVKT
jgi:hypothetical protein